MLCARLLRVQSTTRPTTPSCPRADMTSLRPFSLLALALTLASAPTATAQLSLHNVPSPGLISPFGKNYYRAVGEAFQVTTGNTVLNSFQFQFGAGVIMGFDADIYAWDPVNFHITGPALFSTFVTTTST